MYSKIILKTGKAAMKLSPIPPNAKCNAVKTV